MKNIKLTDAQYKLLLSLLDELADKRSSCGCNDVYEDEVKMFSVCELQEALESMGKGYYKQIYKDWQREIKWGNMDGTWEDVLKAGEGMCDTTFIYYLKNIIKKQGK